MVFISPKGQSPCQYFSKRKHVCKGRNSVKSTYSNRLFQATYLSGAIWPTDNESVYNGGTNLSSSQYVVHLQRLIKWRILVPIESSPPFEVIHVSIPELHHVRHVTILQREIVRARKMVHQHRPSKLELSKWMRGIVGR